VAQPGWHWRHRHQLRRRAAKANFATARRLRRDAASALQCAPESPPTRWGLCLVDCRAYASMQAMGERRAPPNACGIASQRSGRSRRSTPNLGATGTRGAIRFAACARAQGRRARRWLPHTIGGASRTGSTRVARSRPISGCGRSGTLGWTANLPAGGKWPPKSSEAGRIGRRRNLERDRSRAQDNGAPARAYRPSPLTNLPDGSSAAARVHRVLLGKV